MLDCVACKEKGNNSCIIHFYIILYDFINCPAFVDIKLCIKEQQQSKYKDRDFNFLCIFPYVCFAFLCQIKFFNCGSRQAFFFNWEPKKWSLVAFNRWSSHTLTTVREFAQVDSALVVLDEWQSYGGGRLNIFDCNALS